MTEAVPPDACRLVWQFNMLPSLYCDESWLPEGLPPALVAGRVVEHAVCHRVLSPWLLSRCRMEALFAFEFSSPLQRLTLLDCDALQRLAPVFGVLACGESMRQTVASADLWALREACGVESVGFLVMAAAEFLPPQEMRGESGLSVQDAVAHLPFLGQRLLLALASREGEAIARRVRLKFPKTARLRMSHTCSDGGEWAHGLGSWVAEELMPQVLPEWTWLFS